MKDILREVGGMTIIRVPLLIVGLMVFTIIIPDFVAGSPRNLDVQIVEMAGCGVLGAFLNRLIISPKEDNNE